MKGRSNLPLRVAAITASTAVVGVLATFPAVAAGGDVQVTNTETVQVYTDATGAIETTRIYEQLALTGDGSVDLRNPIATDGLRNLDGFGGFDVEDGDQITRLTVNGEERVRSVSDYAGDLPLDVQVRYFLDGEPVEPADVVGEDGELEVRYVVKNVTAVEQEVSFDDGRGGTVTKTVEVPIPMVGSLTTVAPSSFTDVASSQANMAGDGKGGTKLSFTMTLFPPIGSDTAEFGYTANITDGVVPRASISALPVNPLESPSFKSAGESYKGGADTGVELTDGASQIDANLLKLRDGAGELLAGLIQLRDGAVQLEAGLSGVAAPGAARLADGAGELRDGIFKIDDGAGKLAAGSSELSSGAARLGEGARKIDDGAGQLADGSGQLAEGTAKLSAGTRRLDRGAKTLAAGTEMAASGAGQLSDGAKTLSGGLNDLADGAFDLDSGAAQIADGQASLLAGLKLLESGVQNLPATVRSNLSSNAQYQGLLSGMQEVVVKIGAPTDVTDPVTREPATLFGALNAVQFGLRYPSVSTGVATDCEEVLVDPSNAPEACGVADALDLMRQSFEQSLAPNERTDSNPGGFSDLQGLLASANGAYDVVTQAMLTSGAACPARDAASPLNLPPVPALSSPNPACRAAATAAYGYGAPAGLPEPFTMGGVIEKSTAAKNSLATITGKIDTLMVPGLMTMKSRLFNPHANPNCAIGKSTSADPTDDCGLKQAVGFFGQSIPVLVDGISSSIAATLLQNISVPSAGCDPRKPTLICGAGALAAGGSELAAGTDKFLGGAGQLDAGGSLLAVKVAELAAGLVQIDAGAGQLAGGTGELSAGAGELNAGAGKLAAGAGELAAGTGQLADGSGALVDGAERLSDGAGQLADGTGRAADGAGQVADGAGQLVDGLGDAADGSGRLADGLDQAAAGAPQLRDGAQRLSDEGTSKLVDAGEATAQNYGEMYAVLEAGAERAQSEKMVYGAPEGAFGLAAYSYEIKGEDGEGSRNLARGLGGAAVLAAGAGAFALRRRLI